MKKFLALIMVVAMVASFASVVTAADDSNVVARFTFTNGKDEGLTENGSNFTYANGAVTLGAESYLTADASALKGLTAMTIAMKVKGPATDTKKAAWVYEISSEEKHAYPTEHYLGMYYDNKDNPGKFSAQRYSNPNGRPTDANKMDYNPDVFMSIVVVYPDDGSIIVYADGKEVANVPQSENFDLSLAGCIGENPHFQIGKANWDNGEYAEGVTLSELVVYNTALTAEEAAAVTYADDPTTPAQGGSGAGGAGGGAPATGFATVAIAIAAVGSGAYVVSKKRH